MQGVSINLFVKTGAKKSGALAKVFHFDLYGKRAGKYEFLNAHTLKQVKFKKLKMLAPQYYFVAKDYKLNGHYERGFSVDELFKINGVGITTAHDEFSIGIDKSELLNTYREFQKSPRDAELLHRRFNVAKKKGWDILSGWGNLQGEEDIQNYIMPVAYRPFDTRFIFYEKKLVWRPVDKVMRHFIDGENIGLIFKRGGIEEKAAPVFLTKHISESRSWSRPGMQGVETNAPLYLYPEPIPNTLEDRALRDPNLNMGIVNTIADSLGLRFVIEKQQDDKQQDAKTFAPIDLLDYIYAVLHSPAYREKYIEFLKIDFPRVPYPTDKTQFRKLAKLGGQLRELHLLQTDLPLITEYNHSGDNTVDKVNWQLTDNKLGEVHINKNQRFEKVPATAWEFYIGGYQPAQKWLKDRKGIALTADDIRHWQKIIVALSETEKLMAAIDSIQFIQ